LHCTEWYRGAYRFRAEKIKSDNEAAEMFELAEFEGLWNRDFHERFNRWRRF